MSVPMRCLGARLENSRYCRLRPCTIVLRSVKLTREHIKLFYQLPSPKAKVPLTACGMFCCEK